MINDPAIKLGPAKPDSNYPVEIRMESSDGAASNRHMLDIALLSAAESGDFKCTVSIPVLMPTNHPPIAISVSGRIGVELCAVPGILYIPLSDTPVQRRFTLKLLGQRSRVQAPESLRLPKQAGADFKAVQAADGRSLDVTAAFSPDFTRQLLAKEKIMLVFRIQGASAAQVVCRFKN